MFALSSAGCPSVCEYTVFVLPMHYQQLLSGVQTPVPIAGSQRLPLGDAYIRLAERDARFCSKANSNQWRTRRGGGGGEGGRHLRLENSGQTLFSRQAQVAQKSWKTKNISIQWKMSGQILFFRASAGCSEFWMIKNMYSMQWIQGTLFFSAQAQVAQKSGM